MINGTHSQDDVRSLDARVGRLEVTVAGLQHSIDDRIGSLIELIGSPPNPALGTPGKGLVGSVNRLLEESAERARESRERTERLTAWGNRLTFFGKAVGIIVALAGAAVSFGKFNH